MPALKKNEAVSINNTTIKALKTNPPARYTGSSLLSLMKNVSRFVSEPDAKKTLKETAGLGTSATRASIIEGLKKRYLTVEKGKFIPNETAMKLISLMQGSKLTDPAYTAYMEQQLEEIVQNRPAAEFMAEVKNYIKEFVAWAEKLDIIPNTRQSKYETICKCPVSGCNGEIIAYPKVFSCTESKESKYTFALWRNGLEKLRKANITDNEAKKLINGYPTGTAVNLHFKKGSNKYTAPARIEKGEKGYYVKVIFK